MEDYAQYNNFEICPYNNSHRVQAGTRFQRHLIECRKNYPDVEEEVCPFNFTHRVKKPELKYHILNCPDADSAIKQIVTVKDERRYEPPVLGLTYEQNPGSGNVEECWDDDLPAQPIQIDRAGWNSKLQILNADRLSGLKPADKKRIIKQLAQGSNLEDIRNSQQEGKETLIVTKNVLKQMPLPTLEPYTNQLFKKPRGRGFVVPEAGGGSRIRADIFSTCGSHWNPLVPSASLPLSMGRGVASFVARPPPGLANLPTVMPNFGRGLATLPNGNGNANGTVPPGFGAVLETNSNKSDENDNVTYEDLIADLCPLDLKDEVLKPQLSEKEERAKRRRRIEKKLKQIEHLKNKIKNGEMLNDEETAKVKGEKKLRREYESLDH